MLLRGVMFAIALMLGATQTTAKKNTTTRPVGTLSEDGLTLAVSFTHQSQICQFSLTANSIYSSDAKITAHSDEGEHEMEVPAKTHFVSRKPDRWASAMVSDKGEVDGVFQCDGKLFDFPKIARRLSESVEFNWDSARFQVRGGGRRLDAETPLGDACFTFTSKETCPAHCQWEDDICEENFEVSDEGDWSTPPAAYSNAAALSDWSGTRWWPGCYNGDSRTHRFKVGLVIDVDAWEEHGDQLDNLVATIISRTSFVYENQFNIRIEVGSQQLYKSDSSAPDFARGCPDINTRLNQLQAGVRSRQLPLMGATHVLTGCGTGYGTVGLAYVGSLCATRGTNTGVNQLHNAMNWVTFAHELGHNFGGGHTFEQGQGQTGGIMDYGDGKLNGQYQFNTRYRKSQMCQRMDQRVAKCSGNFDPATSNPTPTPTLPTPTPPTPTPPTPAGGANCYGIEACRKAAQKRDLDISGGSDGRFAGRFSEVGCYYYTKDPWKNMAVYGVLDNGREATTSSQLTSISAQDQAKGKVRLDGDCSSGPATSTPTPRPPTPTPPGCVDRYTNCVGWKQNCNSNRYGEWMKGNCKETCNACGDTCADDYNSCSTWAQRGYCEQIYVQYVQRHCPKSCNSCGQASMAEGSVHVPDFGAPAPPPDVDLELADAGIIPAPLLVIVATMALQIAFFS